VKTCVITTLESTSWINEESASVLTTNYFRLMILRWSIMTQDISVTLYLKCYEITAWDQNTRVNLGGGFTVPLQEVVSFKKSFFH